MKKDGTRSWVFIYRYGGKQRELGVGKAGDGKGVVSLKAARGLAVKGEAMLDRQPPVDPRTVWRARPRRKRPHVCGGRQRLCRGEGPRLEEPQARLSVASHDRNLLQAVSR